MLAIVTASAISFALRAQNILTSIKPIQMITLEITKGISTPDVLLSNNISPHGYSLRPSDLKRIERAKLIIWYGHNLEPFLEKILLKRRNILELSELFGLKSQEKHHVDKFSDYEHDHKNHDPHFWLGKKPTIRVAQAIAYKLVEMDPENKVRYLRNLSNFVDTLEHISAKIDSQLKPVREKGYYVFHDAYKYFEKDYALNHLGYFTIIPDRKPGAKTLMSIRTALLSNKAKCVFSELQFPPSLVHSSIKGSAVNVGVLDPIGSSINVENGSYFRLLQSLSDSFSECLMK
ncbi:high-affinity zinc uptake system protein [Candidatus Photodesmus blepharus]|uniref:High-affinity zinc uptake system protein ZnuA n=1 Tax=Candidatus Photodesmus blepharonis TaxID=1179155 RepID=A0A084CNB8_9GAMM|nr:high-affinity zinc uptake system protein [Candidatus Photodesmus blepharus]